MKKFMRPVTAMVLTMALGLALFIPAPAVSADPGGINLEQAIHKAKTVYPDTDKYTDFQSNYNSTPEQNYWQLSWSYTGGNLYIAVDADSNEIIGIQRWESAGSPETSAIAPAIDLNQAQKIAEAKLNELLPQKKDSLKLMPAALLPLGPYNSANYTFVWQRFANGVMVVSDQAYMVIEGQSGEVINYSLNWTKSELPELISVITPEKAQQAFINEKALEKQYLYNPYPVAVSRSLKTDSPDSQLVFALTHASGGNVDAIHGNLLVLAPGKWEQGASYDMAANQELKAVATEDAGEGPILSPQEITELEKNSKLITYDEAITKINSFIDIPDNATLQNVGLEQDWSDPSIKLWRLNWTVTENDVSIASIYAAVQATDGRIRSFHIYEQNKNYSGVTTQDEAQTAAQDFINKIEPGLAGSLRLEEDSLIPIEPYYNENDKPSEYYFTYTRLVNGIPCPRQGIGITVSSQDNSVTGYDLTWYDIDFADPSSSMDLSLGSEAWLKNAPLTLCYIKIVDNDGSSSLIPVYKPIPLTEIGSFNYISAFGEGVPLDYQGQPLSTQPVPHVFNDINDSFAKSEISLLGQAGLFGEYGDQFKPNQNITWSELLRGMAGAYTGAWTVAKKSDEEILIACKNMGWEITESLKPSDAVSHAQLVQTLLQNQQIRYLARQSSIFVNPYPQDNSITADLNGYVAIAQSFGLFPDSYTSFNAEKKSTRAEAAYALVHSLKTAR